MKFKSASIYASVAFIILAGLFYSDNVNSVFWIPSFFKQMIVVVLLIPIFTWLYIVEGFGRRDPRPTDNGGLHGRVRLGTRITLSLFFVPLTLIASPPVIWGNFDGSWKWLGLAAFFIGSYSLALLWSSRIRWDDQAFFITSPFHMGDRVFEWHTLSDIEYKRNSEYATLTFENSGKAHVGHYLEGYTDLMSHAERRIKHA